MDQNRVGRTRGRELDIEFSRSLAAVRSVFDPKRDQDEPRQAKRVALSSYDMLRLVCS